MFIVVTQNPTTKKLAGSSQPFVHDTQEEAETEAALLAGVTPTYDYVGVWSSVVH